MWDALSARVVKDKDARDLATREWVEILDSCGMVGYRNNELALAATQQLQSNWHMLSSGIAEMSAAMHGIGQMTFRHNEQVRLFDKYAEAMLHNPNMLHEITPTQV